MTNDPMTYQQLHHVLTHLGFSCQRAEPKWLYYEHKPSNTVIILVEKKPTDKVRISDDISARRHLIEKGLISEEELNKRLSQTSAPEKPTAGKRK